MTDVMDEEQEVVLRAIHRNYPGFASGYPMDRQLFFASVLLRWGPGAMLLHYLGDAIDWERCGRAHIITACAHALHDMVADPTLYTRPCDVALDLANFIEAAVHGYLD